MTARAPLIDELEDILNNGGSDQELCDKAIEIVDWLMEEKEEVDRKADLARHYRLREQEDYFTEVIEQIQKRRHEHALDVFEAHCIDQGYFDKNI